jgi:hypothetical protein
MPVRSLQPRVIYNNIVRDFEAAWNGITASSETDIGRGNFLFAFMGTLLLEWSCRVCAQDLSGAYLDRFTTVLEGIEPLYFTELPSQCRIPAPRDFQLPLPAGKHSPVLLGALFDLIRNGEAHQYQQIPARLDNNSYLWISIRGAGMGKPLTSTVAQRRSDHLAFCEYSDGNIGIRLHPDTFFFDIRTAVEDSGILESGIMHEYLTRDYRSQRAAFLTSLKAAKHSNFREQE